MVKKSKIIVSFQNLTLLRKATALFVEVVIILICTKIPYVNLLFPLWIDLLLIWLGALILFHLPNISNIYITLVLWIVTAILSLSHIDWFNENVGIVIYILLAVYIVQSIFLYEKK